MTEQGVLVDGRQHNPSWEPAGRMVEALKRKSKPEAARLRDLLCEAERTFKPLGEPFLTDFGLHRWLKKEREESYSDWLEWIIQQISEISGGANLVLELLNISWRAEIASNDETSKLTVDRETLAYAISPDKNGRLDLLINYGGALIVVEVKVTDPEHADTAKQEDYMCWLKAHAPGKSEAVLVALEGEKDIYKGFRLLEWSGLCIKLRRLIRDKLLVERPLAAALALAFVGAVEQNLLGFSSQLARAVKNGQVPTLMISEMSDYLERFLKKEVDHRGQQS